MQEELVSDSAPLTPHPRPPPPAVSQQPPGPVARHAGRTPAVLIVVEGTNDIQFLRRISTMLHADSPSLPDLVVMERLGELVFIPFGGSDLRHWLERLAGFGSREFHLFDRALGPVTQARYEAARIVNQRAGCRACVTRKRALENYLHPAAISECRPIQADFSDEDDVADLVARQCFLRQVPNLAWTALPSRARKRLRSQAKRWLNTSAVERMTVSRLVERDSADEVRSWLISIADLARNAPP